MREIIDYVLVRTEYVKEYIDNGWQPWGSPIEIGVGIVQAMVKYKD